MARLSVLILAAIVATLLLAAEFYGPFAFQRSAGYGRGWGDVCGWLTKPIPMALVTLGPRWRFQGTAHGCRWWSIWRRQRRPTCGF